MNSIHIPSTLFGFRLRTLVIVAVILLAGAVALALDLYSEGLVYDLLWDVTGETEPPQQVLGVGQYLARFTRQQPNTAPYARLQHNDVSPFGVNTFLAQEVEPAKRARQVQMIAGAGFTWVRQQFAWEDIEIHGKGDFIDRRNDATGPISAWLKYDHIVALVEQYGLRLIVRLSQPPAWSQPEGTTNPYTPPEDFDDFVDYAVAVASRYRGRIHHYQVWNEPNLYPEWGDQTVNAEAYTDLLCRTYDALKAVDPAIVVISGTLGPTIDLSGRNAYDLLYLQRMYQAGAGDCFDVLSVQGYGLWSGPTDRRLRQVTVNYQRHLWIRDMMVANGDAHKPIWISEAAWNPVPNDPAISDLNRYGRVTMAQAAEWAPLAYERALHDWPWIGVINYWYFKPTNEREIDQSQYYFRLVAPDFTPTPIWTALAAYVSGEQPKPIGAGRHGPHGRALHAFAGFEGGGQRVGVDVYTYRFDGTAFYVCYDDARTGGQIAYALDGQPGTRAVAPEAGDCIALAGDRDAGEHTLRVMLPSSLRPDSVIVVDRGLRARLPWLLAGGIAAALAAVVLARAAWLRVRSVRGA